MLSIWRFFIYKYYTYNEYIEKFRPSPTKGIENQKFVPVNLHLEQFLVESLDSMVSATAANGQQESMSNEQTCYTFTSVGAFTTIHTNKPSFRKSVEQLILSDKEFVFEKESDTDLPSVAISSSNQPVVLHNEIVVHFYALKLFIQASDSIQTIKKCYAAHKFEEVCHALQTFT